MTRQRTIDLVCLIVGSTVGAGATAGFVVHRFLRARLGDPDGRRDTPGGN